MKNLTLLFIILMPLVGFGQIDTIIKPGFTNVATLIIDFETNEFEGGNIAYYECLNCSVDSFSYNVKFISPGDFGGISFTLQPQVDTFFDATIIWSGLGEIQHPNSFGLSYPFVESDIAVEEPIDIKYLEVNGDKMLEGSSLWGYVTTVWNVIGALDITNVFAANDYKAIIYFYPPSVGATDFSVAKWVVFLYHTDMTNATNNITKSIPLNLYPNPTKNKIILDTGAIPTSLKKPFQYEVTNIAGTVLQEGRMEGMSKQIDLSALVSGMYYLTVFDREGQVLSTNKVVKE